VLQSFAGGALFGVRTGTGTPNVLALPGWRRSHQDFIAVLAPAGDETPLDAIAPDLPGFGATPPPAEAWGSAEYADCVAELLPGMAGPVVVLGHSFGGKVAVQLAAYRPDHVRALVLTGVPQLVGAGRPRRPAAAFRLIRSLHQAGLVSDERMAAARRRYGSSDYRAAEGIMREVLVRSLAEHYEGELDAIRCPVTLVWGDDDTAAPLAGAQQAASRLADADLVVCPGAGHLTPSTVPDVLRRAVVSHLGRVPPRTG